MIELKMPSRLSKVLDTLWQAHDARHDIASRLVADLSEDSLLILAAWDTAATFGPIGGQLLLSFPKAFTITDDWGRTLLSAEVALSSEVSISRPLLFFTDTSWAVVLKSDDFALSETTRTHSIVSLLLAMQIIRDHIDSTLLKPHDIRQQELDDYALQAGFEAEHFRRLTDWFSRISDTLLESRYLQC